MRAPSDRDQGLRIKDRTGGGNWFLPLLVTFYLILAPYGATNAASLEDQVHAIASGLRCPVCQNLSVGDSPSELANQMRQIIRERLQRGESRAQIEAYFVSKYGEWILLSPPKRGFNWLVWGLPFLGIALGLVGIGVVLYRWTHKPKSQRPEAPPALSPDVRARIKKELEELEES